MLPPPKAELEGDVERAQRYYALATGQSSDALVDTATAEAVVGEPVAKVAGNAEPNNLQVNRMNVAAIGLLQKDRAPEADVILQRALDLDPRNPFTLNNLGSAEEKQGEWEKALSYNQATNIGSREPVIGTVSPAWRANRSAKSRWTTRASCARPCATPDPARRR
jgi:tetratricopeptide (TPR) repeat protein